MPPPLPVEKKPWGAWVTVLWGVVVVIAWQGLAAMIALLWFMLSGEMNMSSLGGDSEQQKAFEEAFMNFFLKGDVLFFSLVPGTIIGCFLCWMLGKLRRGYGGGEYLGLVKFDWRRGLLILVIYLGIALGMELVAMLGEDQPVHESQMTMVNGTSHWLFLFVAVVICASFGEEFLFRGLLHTSWRETWMGKWGSAVLTSALWTIIHVQYLGNPSLLAFLFLLGLLMTFARELTGSLWVPIGIHAVNNVLSLWQTYAYLEG